jgi:hypothetical protein
MDPHLCGIHHDPRGLGEKPSGRAGEPGSDLSRHAEGWRGRPGQGRNLSAIAREAFEILSYVFEHTPPAKLLAAIKDMIDAVHRSPTKEIRNREGADGMLVL